MDNKEALQLLEYLENFDPSVEQQAYIDGLKAGVMISDKTLDWDDALEPLDYLMIQYKNELRDEHRDYEEQR